MKSLVKIVAAGAAVVAATSLAACGSSGGSGKQTASKDIRLYVSGDVNEQDLWAKALIPGFEKANPGYKVHLTFDEHGVNDTTQLAKLGAAVKTKRDYGYDVIDTGFVPSAVQGNLLAKPDSSKLPNMAGISQDLLPPVKGMAVPYRGTAVALAYNTKFVKNPPKTLDALLAWIKAHPGKFTYNSPNSGGAGGGFVTTVVDKYVPAGPRKTMTNTYDKADEKYWKDGLATLKGLKPSIYQHVYPNGNQAVLDLLGKESIWMAPAWVDQTLSAQQAGTMPKSIKLTTITGPTFPGGGDYLGVPKNDGRIAAADKLINYTLTPDAQAKVADVMSGFPAIDITKLPAALQKKFAGVANPTFRQGYQTNLSNDLNQQWQSNAA
ncbi:MAG TPA: extracellular solute-binding protein [Mycobacteriales bacterium]|nr:extracellular solute-binding protein [Mycobacteriales bacterium]